MKTDRPSTLLPRVTRLRLTEAVRCRIAIVRRAARLSYPQYELAKIELADEILALVDEQEQAARLRRLPERAAPAVVSVCHEAKRRRRA